MFPSQVSSLKLIICFWRFDLYVFDESVYMFRLIICQLLAVAGAPYDTLEEVIGIRDSNGLGSLKDFGINYREVPVCFCSFTIFKPSTSSTFLIGTCALTIVCVSAC